MLATAQGEATLDGAAAPVDRVEAVPIVYAGQEGNPVTGSAGVVRAFGCGLWLWIPPLSTGEHELTLRGSSKDFTVDVSYQLTVD